MASMAPAMMAIPPPMKTLVTDALDTMVFLSGLVDEVGG
jgi:hypothetical protein